MLISNITTNANFVRLLLAVTVTILMTAVSWFLAGSPGTNGIDDAAITRSYSENLANGYGFVYFVGGERVEGATSFLWTLLLVVPYLFKTNPEFIILAITSCLTALAIFIGLRIAARAVDYASPIVIALGMAISLIGLPGFFIWSVWSMMEIALWTMLCMFVLDRLSYLIEAVSDTKRFDLWLALAALALPLTRPEGIMVVVGLCALAIVLRPIKYKPIALAILTSIVSFAAITAGRLSYFGFPFPNTYYAKVSSDRLQNIADGAKYFFSFVSEHPFAEVLIASWIILGAHSIMGMLKAAQTGQRTRILCTAFVLGILAAYLVLGGDHFVLWRFYQPIMTIIALPIVIALVWIGSLAGTQKANYGFAASTIIAVVAWFSISCIFYYQSRFNVAREFQLSQRGEDFGQYLNGFEPHPTIGVVAAGGVALTYDGEIRDLFGLNWVEMAHANPVKVGFRNHASFDVQTFWRYQPEVLPQYHKAGCQRHNWTEQSGPSESGVKQLFSQARFQATYSPMIFETGNGKCVNAFAANTWLAKVADSRIVLVDWADLTILDRS